MAVLDNLDYLGWLHQDGHLSWEDAMSEKYILYARKSTDVEDKQVLSIEAQLVELRAYARNENLQIIDELIEKQSAKVPGRPVFNRMLKQIEAGEAKGIIAWHPDRLARNSIDGGQIIYLLDQTHLNSLKFPSFWFENTSQGKFMLSIAFGQSKYYVDNLSVNTKRGLRQKVRRGEMPGVAPIGYYNDMRTKIAKVDKKTAPIVAQAFELYARGDQRLDQIADFLYVNGIQTKPCKVRGKTMTGKKPYSRNRITHILSNPFYYGHFRYLGEVHEGKHTAIISKRLFDQVQEVLKQRGKPQRKANDPKPLCGLVYCACGMMFTAETHIKRQKNGNVHTYTYYRCTRKSKTVVCREPHIRAEELDKQLSALLLGFSLPKSWADKMRELMSTDELSEKADYTRAVGGSRTEITHLSDKLQRLLDSYLDGDVERELYQDKRAEILGQKKRLEEKVEQTTLGVLTWVEPMKQWLDRAVSICRVAKSDDLPAKKSLCREIFGSNLKIQNKEVGVNADNFRSSPQENLWSALRAAKEKAGATRPSVSESSFLVRAARV